MQYLVPSEHFFHRAIRSLLVATALGTTLATVLHSRQSNPRALDLIVPPAVALIMIALLVYLHKRPHRILRVIGIASATFIAAIAIPAWYYTIAAWGNPHGSLVATLPPITSLLMLQLLVLIVFVHPRRLLLIAVGAWFLVAAPILVYLIAHPQELASPRGLDLVVALGPVILSVVLFIPFQQGVELWISKLQGERVHALALAERDPLTGLYNRRAAERLLADALAAPDVSDVLILFDLDRFKAINDTHGHGAGDSVLREVAQRCGPLLRKKDLFARWGGEEFVVLIRGAEEAGVTRVAHALREAISATAIAPAGTVTASFGVARLQWNDTATTWVKRADEALYEGKAAGRNRVIER